MTRCFDVAQELEEVALQDEYFIERKLYPNVDFYSGVIYRAMGIPEQMFTVLFAIGRLPGWIAHWREMHANPTIESIARVKSTPVATARIHQDRRPQVIRIEQPSWPCDSARRELLQPI